MMIGSGMPSSQNRIPRPKPMAASRFGNDARRTHATHLVSAITWAVAGRCRHRAFGCAPSAPQYGHDHEKHGGVRRQAFELGAGDSACLIERETTGEVDDVAARHKGHL